jgi:hypothetical protein
MIFGARGKRRGTPSARGVKEELLRRLLELNFEIAAKEQSAVSDQLKGKKGKTAGKRDAGKRGKKTSSGGEESGSQLGLL